MSHYLQVQSVQGHILKIEKSDLKFAITIGRLYSGNLHLMVNKRLESVYTRTYMSEHLLPGMAPRAKKLANTPPTPVKPGLPKEDVVAVSRKCSILLHFFLKYFQRFFSLRSIYDSSMENLSRPSH